MRSFVPSSSSKSVWLILRMALVMRFDALHPPHRQETLPRGQVEAVHRQESRGFAARNLSAESCLRHEKE